MLLALRRGPTAMQSEFDPARLAGGGPERQGSGVLGAVTPLEEAGDGKGSVLRSQAEPAESSEPRKFGGSRVEARVYGGGRLLRGGDVNEAVANTSRFTVSSLYEFEEIVTLDDGDVPAARHAGEYGADVLVRLTPRFGVVGGLVGIESSSAGGWIETPSATFLYPSRSGASLDLRAVALRFGGEYDYPLGGRLSLAVGGGAGLYFTQLQWAQRAEVDFIGVRLFLVGGKSSSWGGGKQRVLEGIRPRRGGVRRGGGGRWSAEGGGAYAVNELWAVPLMENGKPAEVHRARAPVDRTNADRPLPIDPATGAARHVAAGTRRPVWMMSSAVNCKRRARRCPRGGRDGHPATHLDTVAGQRQVQRGIERMQTVVTARRTPRTRNLHCAGGRFRVAFVFTPLRALATASAGALDRTGGLPRAALAAMLLQELAYQLLASPVQFPFEVTHAHLAGFARGEEGFGLGEDGLGRARRRAAGSDAGDDGSHLVVTTVIARRVSLPKLPLTPYQDAAGMSRGGAWKR